MPKDSTCDKETQYACPTDAISLSENLSTLDTSTTSEVDDEDCAPIAEDQNDRDYLPESEESNDEEIEHKEMLHESSYQERKYIVFESCLLQLFTICNVCLAPATIDKTSRNGTMLIVKSTCLQGHSRVWKSQPEHNKMPWGNFLVAAALLFSGSQPSKVLTFFKHLNLASISTRLYSLIQKTYLLPSIFSLWGQHQKALLSSLKGKLLVLGGDGRCDTPGFCAKYGSYTIMDLDKNKIVDTNLVQVIIILKLL